MTKSQCERCQGAFSKHNEAYHCHFECTFCADCVVQLEGKCPNCQGALTRREPVYESAVAEAVTDGPLQTPFNVELSIFSR